MQWSSRFGDADQSYRSVMILFIYAWQLYETNIFLRLLDDAHEIDVLSFTSIEIVKFICFLFINSQSKYNKDKLFILAK